MAAGCLWQLRGAVCAGAGPGGGVAGRDRHAVRPLRGAQSAKVQLQRGGEVSETRRRGKGGGGSSGAARASGHERADRHPCVHDLPMHLQSRGTMLT